MDLMAHAFCANHISALEIAWKIPRFSYFCERTCVVFRKQDPQYLIRNCSLLQSFLTMRIQHTARLTRKAEGLVSAQQNMVTSPCGLWQQLNEKWPSIFRRYVSLPIEFCPEKCQFVVKAWPQENKMPLFPTLNFT